MKKIKHEKIKLGTLLIIKTYKNLNNVQTRKTLLKIAIQAMSSIDDQPAPPIATRKT